MIYSKGSPNAAGIVLRLMMVMAVMLVSGTLVVGAGTACSSGGKAYAALMDSAPEGTGSFAYWAVSDLNEDEDLWEIYSKFKDSPDAEQLRGLIQVLSTVKDAARVTGSDNVAVSKAPVTVLRTKYERKYVEEQLEALKYSRSSYRDVHIWVAGDGQSYRPVALLSGTILMGDVSDLKRCIDARKDSGESLRNDPHIRDLMTRLPDGLLLELDRASVYSSETYVDLVAYGKSYNKAKKGMLKVNAVYLFGDEPAASSAQESVKDYLSATFEGVKVKRDGNLVIATSEISISKFAGSLEF